MDGGKALLFKKTPKLTIMFISQVRLSALITMFSLLNTGVSLVIVFFGA